MIPIEVGVEQRLASDQVGVERAELLDLVDPRREVRERDVVLRVVVLGAVRAIEVALVGDVELRPERQVVDGSRGSDLKMMLVETGLLRVTGTCPPTARIGRTEKSDDLPTGQSVMSSRISSRCGALHARPQKSRSARSRAMSRDPLDRGDAGTRAGALPWARAERPRTRQRAAAQRRQAPATRAVGTGLGTAGLS